ncbi:putative cytochrome P450 oxidoreductase [Exophiala viscosa]|uniref:Cytochrome P450 oxidoreductase n=1 Tax=Exophiala viscosa TaxID=2486360 RepID=A0AAN6IJU2_9EURO|nr:putative cytochrome P450 oxidoreductase [Exophiala viscosa]
MARDLSYLYLCVLVLGVYGVYRLLQVGRRDPRMPKGPPTLPILGNFHQIPSTGMYRQFREWAKEYGSVFSLKFGPSNIIVLCDREAIHELIDKKGSIYSDRPTTYVGNLLTKGDHIAISQADALWREKRKVIAHNFSPKMLDEKHFKVQEAEGVVLMNDLLVNPEGFFNHIRRYTASVAATLVYGQRGSTFDSFWAHGVFDVMAKWTECMEPGANPPVDEYTFLQFIPAKFAHWKKRALQAGDTMDAVWDRAREIIDTRRAKGDKRDCIADRLLDEYHEKGFPMSQHAFNNLIGELVEGGADTTAAQLLTMVLALARNPWVQKKARGEIDALCGASRSPQMSKDFASLPYINAVVKEGMRWRPVAVTALPHKVRQDDYYKGMLIPKDSTIFIPTWAIHHSADIYPDDEAFNPDRFLNYPKLSSEYAAHHYGYGAGRRVCPGMHLAERNMWRITSKLLWAFDISEPIDPTTGETIELDPNAYNPGITQAPLPFRVRITPRSQEHATVLQKELQAALEFLAPFESKE